MAPGSRTDSIDLTIEGAVSILHRRTTYSLTMSDDMLLHRAAFRQSDHPPTQPPATFL